MEETLLEAVETLPLESIDYTTLLDTIITLLEGIHGYLQLIGTLLLLGAIVMVAFGLVYMVYCILKEFML